MSEVGKPDGTVGDRGTVGAVIIRMIWDVLTISPKIGDDLKSGVPEAIIEIRELVSITVVIGGINTIMRFGRQEREQKPRFRDGFNE
ncbi:MAG: hypothetical protein NC114_10615 [Ruminococcus flavefaciens]|nr:hypothetical protein [Ruminococcus flavefaciens]